MNVDNGNIRQLREGEEPSDREVMVEMESLSKSQKRNKRVDLNDTTSVAGKQLQAARKRQGLSYIVRWDDLTPNQKRKMRKKLTNGTFKNTSHIIG